MLVSTSLWAIRPKMAGTLYRERTVDTLQVVQLAGPGGILTGQISYQQIETRSAWRFAETEDI